MTEWPAMRQWCEYAAVWIILKTLDILPRPFARALAVIFARLLLLFVPRLKRVAMTNLRLAFPEWTGAQRRMVMRRMARHLGLMAAEFARFPRLTRENIGKLVAREGLTHFEAARQRGNGVIFLTGHMGAWELAPFAQALYGQPLFFLARSIENRRVDALVNRYRCLSGNQPIEKNNSARAMLRVLRAGGTVGILADQNTSIDEGVFVDFFGVPACSTTGLARIARHTHATVLPGFLHWDDVVQKYVLKFDSPLVLQETTDEDADIRENTARFAKVIENCIRAHPDQWLWVHKRWKNQPPGEPSLYSK